MIPWWMAILIFSGGFLPFPSKFNRRCFMGVKQARGLKGKPKWKENSVDDGVRIWKQKKGGNWECHKSGLKDILLHILSGPLGRYSSFLFWLFFFPSFLLVLRSPPPLSLSFPAQEFSSITPLENQLYFYSSPRPFCTHPPRFLYNLPSSVEANNNSRVISHSSRLAHTQKKKKWKEIHSWMTLPERWG